MKKSFISFAGILALGAVLVLGCSQQGPDLSSMDPGKGLLTGTEWKADSKSIKFDGQGSVSLGGFEGYSEVVYAAISAGVVISGKKGSEAFRVYYSFPATMSFTSDVYKLVKQTVNITNGKSNSANDADFPASIELTAPADAAAVEGTYKQYGFEALKLEGEGKYVQYTNGGVTKGTWTYAAGKVELTPDTSATATAYYAYPNGALFQVSSGLSSYGAYWK